MSDIQTGRGMSPDEVMVPSARTAEVVSRADSAVELSPRNGVSCISGSSVPGLRRHSPKASRAPEHYKPPAPSSSKGTTIQEARQKWQRQRLRSIVEFVVPALSIVLSDPLMSLLDTIVIGQVCGSFILPILRMNCTIALPAQSLTCAQPDVPRLCSSLQQMISQLWAQIR